MSAEIGEKIRQRKSLSQSNEIGQMKSLFQSNETPQSSLAFKPKSSQSRFTLVREKRQNLCTSSQPSSSSYFQKEEVKSCGSDAAKKSDKDVTFMSSRSSEEEPASTITTTIFNKNLPPEFVKVRECEISLSSCDLNVAGAEVLFDSSDDDNDFNLSDDFGLMDISLELDLQLAEDLPSKTCLSNTDQVQRPTDIQDSSAYDCNQNKAGSKPANNYQTSWNKKPDPIESCSKCPTSSFLNPQKSFNDKESFNDNSKVNDHVTASQDSATGCSKDQTLRFARKRLFAASGSGQITPNAKIQHGNQSKNQHLKFVPSPANHGKRAVKDFSLNQMAPELNQEVKLVYITPNATLQRNAKQSNDWHSKFDLKFANLGKRAVKDFSLNQIAPELNPRVKLVRLTIEELQGGLYNKTVLETIGQSSDNDLNEERNEQVIPDSNNNSSSIVEPVEKDLGHDNDSSSNSIKRSEEKDFGHDNDSSITNNSSKSRNNNNSIIVRSEKNEVEQNVPVDSSTNRCLN